MFSFRSLGKFKGKVKRSYNDVEPQEIFLDKLSRKKEEQMGLSERKMSVDLPGWALKGFAFSVFLLLFLLLGRSFQMQIIEAEEYQQIASRNRTIIEPAKILRGVIYDENDQQLVYNSVVFDLFVDKSKLPEGYEQVVDNIADLINEDSEKLKDKIEQIDTEGKLKSNISHETAIMIEINRDKYPGISVEKTIEREYNQAKSFAHLIGYTGKVNKEEMNQNPEKYMIHDYIGKAGLEKYYEDYLAKERGSYKIKTDSSGDFLEREELNPVIPGNNLKLWIDADLQTKIKETTDRILDEIGSNKAAVVAMDPKTGGILSMLSTPAYDNNVFSRTGDKKLLSNFLVDENGVFLNRTLENSYPAGSVIKPFLAIAALEENIISPQKEIYSPGYFEIPNPWNPSNPTRMMDYKPHGWTDMRKALAVSSNVYFYTVGGGTESQEGLGIKRIKEYLNLFGWGEETGVDLPNEVKGRIPDKEWKEEAIGESWTLGDTYNTSIGQGYLEVTPLQVATAYSAIANGGTLFEPKVVKEIYQDEEVIKKIEPEVKKEDFIDSEHIKVVKEGMKMTTSIPEGTASFLGQLPVSVGAKTGTAQISKEGHFHNWITVFAPYDDPEIVLTILVEEVEGIRATTSRIAYDVLNWYFSQDKVNQEEL
jgi:penicillin-binding protein 2